MKKLFTNEDDLLRSLTLYWLFKNGNVLDAFALAEQMGLTDDSELKGWLERGCKVYFAWLDQRGDLSQLLMSQQSFGMLINKDKKLHGSIKSIRDAASGRWSNDWKKISAKISTAKSLSMVKPTDKELDLSWSVATSTCASLLYKVGQQELSSKVALLSRFMSINGD
jgi:hypothetical protein